MGFAFENPDGAEGGDGGGKDHEGVPDDARFAFGAVFAEDFFGVHHEEEGEVGDGDEGAADDGGGDGESSLGVTGPEDWEHATGEAGETATEEVESFVVVDAVRLSGACGKICRWWGREGFLEGEAVHEHEDDDGGHGHAEDADAEDFLRDHFAREGFEGDGESAGVALFEHGVELEVSFFKLCFNFCSFRVLGHGIRFQNLS